MLPKEGTEAGGRVGDEKEGAAVERTAVAAFSRTEPAEERKPSGLLETGEAGLEAADERRFSCVIARDESVGAAADLAPEERLEETL